MPRASESALHLRLPERSALVKPDEDDPLDYYYRRSMRFWYRRRLVTALELLDRPPGAVLEVGYGSGILLPSLAPAASRLVAIDLHGAHAGVAESLRSLGVDAELIAASVTQMPFDDESFDSVVCLSVLEHLRAPDLTAAIADMRRVTRAGGSLIVGVPVRNPVTDTFFRIAGFSPRDIHPSSHRDVRRALAAGRWILERERRLPLLAPFDLAAYVTWRARRA